ncbi:MAG: Crp/Fnr family transcriptional regulator, partial [Leptolyngbyaceae cyanobacterium SM1_3_5]|nr:Crp/Fnr family transcriptional regulator [Leptolyngbyaceae cyanobacterium SM1_3_5]
MHFQPGEAVFHEGESYRGFFLVQEGACKVFRLSEAGKEAVLSFFLPGQCIALLPLLRQSDEYPASCMALQQSVLLRFDAQPFRALLKHRPSIQSTLQESMASIAEFFRDKTSMLMLEGVEERVTGFLRQIGA